MSDQNITRNCCEHCACGQPSTGQIPASERDSEVNPRHDHLADPGAITRARARAAEAISCVQDAEAVQALWESLDDTAIVDMLADLLHLADALMADKDKVIERARRHYNAEWGRPD